MALEHWLLEMAEARPHELDRVLLDILQTGDSAALTAVVASAATAFPHAAGETLLVLLRSQLCIQLDRQRFASEVSVPSQLDAIDKIYGEERKKADARPHRKSDLECAIIDLQRLGPLMPRVHEILDRHRAEMPPPEEQDDNDRVWRLALHRMDLRQYTSEEDIAEAAVDSEDSDSPEDSRRYIRFNLNEPEPDIREMLEQDGAWLQALNAPLGILGWGLSVFDSEISTTHDPAQWQQRLEEAQAVGEDSGEKGPLYRNGPGIIAAVCVRDHWEEMSDDERDWCVNIICSEIEREGDHWDERVRIQRNSMSADRPCACVLPLLLGKSLSDMQRSRVHQMLVLALTHAIDEVRWYVASGIGVYLWTIDRELALRCANALATEAMLVQSEIDVDSERSQLNISADRDGWDPGGWGRVEQVEEDLESSYLDRRQVNDIEADSASIVRNRFDKADGIADDANLKFDPTRGVGAKANTRILAILVQAATEPTAIAAFERLAHTLVGWWDDDDHHRDMNEPTLNRLLEEFLLRTPIVEAKKILQPILDAIDRHPREVHRLLQGLISVEDSQPNTVQFWSLWKLFADRVRCGEWFEGIDDQRSVGPEMISAVFLGNLEKEGVRHWPSLEGNSHHVHALFEDLPPSSTVLDAYVRFLYDIGEQSLPDAFIHIANRLQEGNPQLMMRKGDTVFHLEVLLQRYVYGRPVELKRQRDLREAVLFLLDLLVENGSSAAFRMRDDFVTPVSIA